MKALITRISIVLGCVAMVAGLAEAQVSGVPGDGVPDIYYFADEGAMAETSMGMLTRPVGTLLVDTDGTDMVALLVGGADGTGNCELCAMPSLPDPNAPPFFSSSWTNGFINGATQFVRTAPLDTDGFVGVIGEYTDDFNIYPDFGLTNYGAGATFDAVFADGGQNWEVTYATNTSGTFLTNVTPVNIIPEPASLSLLGLAVLGMFVGRRR